MAKKKRYPLGTYMKEFSSEAKCREYLANLRWPGGFVCPKCGWPSCLPADQWPISMCLVPRSDLSDSGDGTPQDPHAAYAVVFGVLLCQSGQTRYLRRCADVDAQNNL